ncbi:hypothetical protein ACEA85_28740, partial [Escherichia coli]
LTHLSWAERKIFYRVLGKKFCGLFIYPGQSVRQVVAVAYFHERRSLNNFHRDRVITFEQIAE